MNRLKKAWRILWGEDLGVSHPYRFVSLTYFRDDILALSGNGDLYQIHFPYSGVPWVELVMTNPVRP